MKKITKATVKSFIKNNNNLFVKFQSSFDGMVDGIRFEKNPKFSEVIKTDFCIENTLGIQGAWFVNGSRDRFSIYNDSEYTGISVCNCCGSFTLAIKK